MNGKKIIENGDFYPVLRGSSKVIRVRGQQYAKATDYQILKTRISPMMVS